MDLMLSNVRVAFPALFTAKAVTQGSDPKYSCAFLIGPQDPQLKVIEKAAKQVAVDKWGDKAAQTWKQLAAQDRLVIHDGDVKAQFAGYEGHMYINSTNSQRPLVIDRDRTPLNANDGRPYAGCYVNAKIQIWAQDNQYGKRINASLLGVQFYADGERLAGGGVASEDDFEALPNPEGGATGESTDVFGDEAGGADDLF